MKTSDLRLLGEKWGKQQEEYLMKSTDSKILKNLASHSSNNKSREWEHYLRGKRSMCGRS